MARKSPAVLWRRTSATVGDEADFIFLPIRSRARDARNGLHFGKFRHGAAPTRARRRWPRRSSSNGPGPRPTEFIDASYFVDEVGGVVTGTGRGLRGRPACRGRSPRTTDEAGPWGRRRPAGVLRRRRRSWGERVVDEGLARLVSALEVDGGDHRSKASANSEGRPVLVPP